MNAVEINDDLLVVLDEDGHGLDAHEVRNYLDAGRQVDAWAAEHAINSAGNTARRIVNRTGSSIMRVPN